MLTIRDHGVDDYAELADMDASDVGVLTQDDRDCIRNLAITSFPPMPGSDSQSGCCTALRARAWRSVRRACHQQTAADAHHPHRPGRVLADWFASHRIPVRRPRCPRVWVWSAWNSPDPRISGLPRRSAPTTRRCSPGCAQRLRSHGKIDRFGVRLIRNQLGISEDQELMETCDTPRRALHCALIDTADRPSDNAVETTWRVTPATKTVPAASTVCSSVHCYHSCYHY